MFKKTLTVFFLLIVLTRIESPHVHADTFYPSADTRFCEFAQVGAISYSSLPVNSASSGLTYDAAGLRGVNLSWIKSTDFEDVGDVTYPDARRKNGLASLVWVPPNSIVDLDVYYYNFSNHSINVKQGIFYTSMPNLTSGDLTRLGAPGVYQTNAFRYSGVMVSRAGKAHVINNWKTVPANSYSNLPKGEKFVSFPVIQPIQLQSRTVTPEFREGFLYLKYHTEIKNVSTYNLNNIKVEDTFLDGSKYTNTINLNAGTSKVFDYENCLCNNYSYDFQIPRLKVADPNTHLENAAIGTSDLFSYNPETRVFYTTRGDVGAPSGWIATQGDFTTVGNGDFIQIGLLPYEIHSDLEHISLSPDVKTLPIISDENNKSDVSISTDGESIINIISEISNTGAYIENLKIQIDFDSNVVEFAGENAQYIDGNTVVVTIPKLENSEIVRPELNFRVIDDLTPDEYEIAFHLQIDGGNYYSYSKDLLATITVEKQVTQAPLELNYSLPISKIDYIRDSLLSTKVPTLAKTGQFNFFFVISFFIMVSIWLMNNWQKKLKKCKRQVDYELYFLPM